MAQEYIMSNNNPHNDNNTNPGIPVACDTPAGQHNPHCNTSEDYIIVGPCVYSIEGEYVESPCNTNIEEDNTMEEETNNQLQCDINPDTPFCSGDSYQEEYVFDCFAGPDPDSQEYIDSNWGQQLIDNGCVELGEPQVIELGPATVIEREEEETTIEVGQPVDILPETGAELGFGVAGLLMIAAGVTALRWARR